MVFGMKNFEGDIYEAAVEKPVKEQFSGEGSRQPEAMATYDSKRLAWSLSA